MRYFSLAIDLKEQLVEELEREPLERIKFHDRTETMIEMEIRHC